MTASTPGPDVPMIEHAAGLIRAKMDEPHTAPYHWAGALYEAGMLVPPGNANLEPANRARQAEADLAKTEAELAEVRRQRDRAEQIVDERGNSLDELEAKLAKLQHADNLSEPTFHELTSGTELVRPGDHLVVGCHNVAPADANDLRDQLKQRLPGIEVIVIAGVTGLAVVRPEPVE